MDHLVYDECIYYIMRLINDLLMSPEKKKVIFGVLK